MMIKNLRLFWCHCSNLKNVVFTKSRFYSKENANVTKPIFLRASEYGKKVAIVDDEGSHTYESLLNKSEALASKISKVIPHRGFNPERIAFITPNNHQYVMSQWATWMTGHIAVPLGKMYPPKELEYFIQDSQASVVLATKEFIPAVEEAIKNISKVTLVNIEDNTLGSCEKNKEFNWPTEKFYKSMMAMILYTSGTTGHPKGVLLSHTNLISQMNCLIEAWEWSSDDSILHVLPLHHTHGIVNALMCPLHVGATCVMLPSFDPDRVWNYLLGDEKDQINIFMAVPTIYAKLIAAFKKKYKGTRTTKDFIHSLCRQKIRLMVSGSAPLPDPIFYSWQEITGHSLLERYGMTEIGMALSNPLQGPFIPGVVGTPLPGVEVCITKPNVYSKKGYDVIAQGDSTSTKVTEGCENEPGELYVRGPNVFNGYWNKLEATKKAFAEDKWFKTGDTVQYQDGRYKILGRTSVDIIKNGGYKVSALEVETKILAHPDISEVAVLGVPDLTWGQKVGAVVKLVSGRKELSEDEFRKWCSDRMAPYHVPSVLVVVSDIPRNPIGKVNKKELLNQLFPNGF